MKALIIFLGITIVLDSILYPLLTYFKDRGITLGIDILASLWMIARGFNIINLTILFAFLLKDYV